MKTVTVNAAALRELLEALIGPSYLMMELRATQGVGSNPIDTLVEQYNEAAKEYAAKEQPV